MQAFTLKLREQGFLCYDNLRVYFGHCITPSPSNSEIAQVTKHRTDGCHLLFLHHRNGLLQIFFLEKNV